MISNENLGAIMGAPVLGPDDDRIGTVGQVFVDPTTGTPNWVTVHTGLFGRHESFVPLNDADWDREVLRIPYEKGMVKDAPRIGTDEALDPQSEDELYQYYGLPSEGSEPSGAAEDRKEDDRDVEDAGEPSGGMRLRKYTVTEQQQVTVPVTHEEVRLEPEDGAESTAEPADEETPAKKERGRHRA